MGGRGSTSAGKRGAASNITSATANTANKMTVNEIYSQVFENAKSGGTMNIGKISKVQASRLNNMAENYKNTAREKVMTGRMTQGEFGKVVDTYRLMQKSLNTVTIDDSKPRKKSSGKKKITSKIRDY